jgi:SAM-dependent methyltransferase
MTTDAMAELQRRGRALIEDDRVAFGFGEEFAERALPRLTSREGHAHLFGAMEAVIGAGYFSTPRTIFEAGCGTGSFVLPALERGHDAYGVDNDPLRIAVGEGKVAAYGLTDAWRERLVLGDAMQIPFEANRFDVVLGHQFIEHVPDPAGIISELLRIAKPGGFVVLYAPDYRAPFEAHYQIPWPPFAARWMLEIWLDAFERPHGGLKQIFPVTLFQLAAVFQTLNCDLISAGNDVPIEEHVARHFDLSSAEAVRSTALRMREAQRTNALAQNFRSATSLAIIARKR